jgi:hypothetical protein
LTALDSGANEREGQVCACPSRLEELRQQFRKLSLIDTLALVVTGFGVLALLPKFFHVTNPRQGLVLLSMPIGVYLLARRVRRRDTAATAAVASLIFAIISCAQARFPHTAFFGTTTSEMSFLVLLAGAGLWAIGRELSEPGRELLPIVVTAGLMINVGLGLLQVVARPELGIYATFDGRASGLMSNPVYFASSLSGVWAYWTVRQVKSKSTQRAILVIIGVLAFALGATGSRGSIAGVAVIGIGLVAAFRRRSALYALVVTISGVSAGYLILSVFSARNSARLGNVDGGLPIRIRVWRTTIDALIERPFFGWGFDPFLHSVNDRLSESYVREHQYLFWSDPHNVFILLIYSLGAVGSVAVAIWMISSLWNRWASPFAIGCFAFVLSWMLQPVTISSWPLAFVFFGAAAAEGRIAEAIPSPSRVWTTVLSSAGALLAAAYLSWSLAFASAARSDDADLAESRAGFMIHDPGVAGLVAVKHKNADASGSELERHFARAEELARRTVEQGGAPNNWVLLVETQLLRKDYEAAFATSQEWVTLRPNDPFGLRLLIITARFTGNHDVGLDAFDHLCLLNEPPCVEDVEKGQ